MAFALVAVPIAFGIAMVPRLTVFALSGQRNANRSGRVDLNDFDEKIKKPKLDMLKRLVACHQNGLESLALFAGGVAVCVATGVPAATMDYWAKMHIGARVVFSIVYAAPPFADGYPRTLTWGVSLVSSMALWFAANSAFSM